MFRIYVFISTKNINWFLLLIIWYVMSPYWHHLQALRAHNFPKWLRAPLKVNNGGQSCSLLRRCLVGFYPRAHQRLLYGVWNSFPENRPITANFPYFGKLAFDGNVFLRVDNWNDNCEAKSEAKSPRPLRGLQVDSSLTRNVSYAVR